MQGTAAFMFTAHFFPIQYVFMRQGILMSQCNAMQGFGNIFHKVVTAVWSTIPPSNQFMVSCLMMGDSFLLGLSLRKPHFFIPFIYLEHSIFNLLHYCCYGQKCGGYTTHIIPFSIKTKDSGEGRTI